MQLLKVDIPLVYDTRPIFLHRANFSFNLHQICLEIFWKQVRRPVSWVWWTLERRPCRWELRPSTINCFIFFYSIRSKQPNLWSVCRSWLLFYLKSLCCHDFRGKLEWLVRFKIRYIFLKVGRLQRTLLIFLKSKTLFFMLLFKKCIWVLMRTLLFSLSLN